MFGKLLSSVVKIATSPIDVLESVADVATGGDGSRESRRKADFFGSEIRDGVCKGLEDLDED